MTDRIGIIGAMQVEVDLLLEQLTDDQTTTISDMVFHEGTLAGVPVVVVRCGVGKVNAAMCAQTLIVCFGVTRVINTGVAGALDETLHVGDLVVSTDAVHHDMDVTGLGYAPGVVPEMENGGGKLAFVADALLVQTVLRAAAEVAPDLRAISGRIASGDQFVCEQRDRDRIIDTFGAHCCEMEGTPIAHVCHRNHVPFVIVRAISDNADDSSKHEYRDAEARTARVSAGIVARAVELLAR